MKQNQSSFKSCSMGCLMMLLMGFLFVLTVNSCDGDTNPEDPSSTEQVTSQDPMRT